MKPRIPWVAGLALLLLIPAAASADQKPLSVDDVLRLHFAGVGEEVIISEIIVTGSVFDLDVEDILRLTEAGLSDRLVKFMIDTRLTDQVFVPEEEIEYLPEEDVGETWANVIEEQPEETTTYFVSLNYNYGSWWYRNYWWDYWYWDCGYAPYRSSFVFSIGAWYPGWYSYGYCYSPARWAYRSAWCYNYGWGSPGYDWYYDPYRYHRDRPASYALSRVKYKSGHSSGGSPYVLAGPKLDLRDGTRLTATKGPRLAHDGVRKTRDGKLLVVDRTRPSKRTLTKTVSGSPEGVGRGVRKPAGDRHYTDVRSGRSPTRTVRSPASGSRPTKVKVTRRPTPTSSVSPGKPTAPSERRPTAVKPSPGSTKQPSPRSSPGVKKTKTRAPTPSVKAPSTRGAPRSSPPKRAPSPRRSPRGAKGR